MKLKVIVRIGIVAAVLSLSAGCIAPQPGHVRHYPPPPAPRAPEPPVVVVRAPAPSVPARPGTSAAVVTPAVVHARPDMSISDRERELIRDYLSHGDDAKPGKRGKGHGGGLPPGLAKKAARGEPLPPGWQKRVVRGETMPGEVFERCEPLPEGLTMRLPAPPLGTVIVSIEGRVVRLMRATMEILDAFDVL